MTASMERWSNETVTPPSAPPDLAGNLRRIPTCEHGDGQLHLRRRRAEWVWQLAAAAGAVTLMGCALAVAAVVCGAVIDG